MLRRTLARYLLVAISAGTISVGGAPARAAPAPWHLSWHGYAFLDSNRQDGPSGERVFESVNHFMVIAARPLGAWSMELLGTFTLEPATVPPEGSPLLFQRGETFNGTLLIDKQHPHDLFAQLGAAWTWQFAQRQSLRLYAALRGEPRFRFGSQGGHAHHH
jgi:hypothetical protein